MKQMAEYKKIDWKVSRRGNQLYIQDNVVRKPHFKEDPEIEYGHAGQGELNRQRRKNKEYAQTMNRHYIAFLITSALLVFASAALYLGQISQTTKAKKNIQSLSAQVSELKETNDELETNINSKVNVAEIRRIAMEELHMVYAGEGQVVTYNYDESGYVRQYEDIPKK